MKELLFTIMLMLSSMVSIAQDRPNALTVWSKDGKEAVFALADKPVVSFSETDLIVSSVGVEVNYPIGQMQKLSYDYDETLSVVDIETNTRAVSLRGITIVFGSLPGNSRIVVSTSDGAVVLQKTIPHAGSYSLSIDSLKPGLYLVNANNTTIKILVR